MDSATLTETAATLHAAKNDSLTTIVEELTTHAQAANLRVLPVLSLDPMVLLDHRRMTAQQVVDAATASGATLLYLSSTVLDGSGLAATIRDTELPDDAAKARRAVLKELARMDGWITEVEVGFAHQGVLAGWAVTAPWSKDLDEDTLDRLRDPDCDDIADQRGNLKDSEITRLAGQLARVAEFRRAVGNPEKTIAARQVPELAALLESPSDDRWEASRVVGAASEIVAEQVVQCIERLTPRRGELAALLAEDREFRVVRTAEARRRSAHVWILQHSEGLRLSNWWIEELVAAAKDNPAQLSFG
jgi:hypothetical protein